jgi:8-oxo-dGTP pyrophosphatase MutT (NUDIX family)
MKKLIPSDAILIPDEAECVFHGEIHDVYQWPQVLYDGSEATFEMLKRPDTVSVLCVVGDKLLVLDDEQPHSGMRVGLPGGRVDKTDESIEAAAQREVLEETGYSFKNWRILRVWQPHFKSEWFNYLLLAEGVIDKQSTKHDAGEKIIAHEVSFDEAKRLLVEKSGYFSGSTSFLQSLTSIEQLLSLPAYSGREVDR